MKASELQIGDYVNYRGQIIKITSLYDKGDSNEVGWSDKESVWVNADNVKPIPLTPEILEKNGFIKDENEGANGTTYHTLIPTGYEANSYTIQITLYKEPICGVSVLLKIWGWVPPYQAGTNDIHLCSANYVHELQHALKLCGIEKEITL